MPSVPTESIVLIAAGLVAGTIGSAGGITSLVSYSALLAVGVPPLPANVSNLVAAVACWPGSALTSRRELTATRRSLARTLPIAACAAGAGSLLLLITPPGVFSRVVPFLVALASLVLLVQPWLAVRAARRPDRARLLAWPLVGLVSIYAGYFGAGSGVMLLALLLVLVDDRLPEANAIKNMLLGVTALVSAVIFVLAGPVDWTAVAPLALGLFGGSAIGPVIARRLSSRAIRWAVAALGFALPQSGTGPSGRVRRSAPVQVLHAGEHGTGSDRAPESLSSCISCSTRWTRSCGISGPATPSGTR